MNFTYVRMFCFADTVSLLKGISVDDNTLDNLIIANNNNKNQLNLNLPCLNRKLLFVVRMPLM